MSFLFYIDGQLTDQPVNDRAVSTRIFRDDLKGGMLISQEAKPTWNGNNQVPSDRISGYAYLKQLFDDGICNQADLVIYDQWPDGTTRRKFTGTINVRSMQIDRHEVLLTTEVQDNSYGAFINNNRNIEYSLNSDKTKSKQNIIPPPIYDVDLFNSGNGIYGSAVGVIYQGYRLYDVFEFLVSAISDNRVTMFSSFLQTLSPDIFVFDGASLLNAGTVDPNVIISFGKLFEEIQKLKDIGFYIDTTDPDAPILRIEQRSTLYSGVTIATLTEEIKKLTSRAKNDKLYGTVRVGAGYNPGGAAAVYTLNAGASYFGFKEEVYTPIGQCNLDTELDLVNDFIIASNAINDQILGQTEGQEEEIFLIECENVDTNLLTADAKRYTYFGQTAPPYFYNLGLNNSTKLQVHGNNFQSTVNNTQQIGGNGFKASLGQDLVVLSNSPGSPVFPVSDTEPVVFADENTGSNYDGNNNYDNTSGIFVAPAPGDYSFNALLRLSFENLKFCENATITVVSSTVGVPAQTYTNATLYYGAVIRATLKVYTDNTLTGSPIFTTTKYLGSLINDTLNLNINLAATLSTGNAVVVQIEGDVFRTAGFTTVQSSGQTYSFPPIPLGSVFGVYYGITATISGCGYSPSEPKLAVVLLEDSFYTCNGTPDGGIVLSGNDSEYYKPYQHEFEYPINESTWIQIVGNPTGAIEFTKDGVTYSGHIDDIIHDDDTGATKLKLTTSNATTA